MAHQFDRGVMDKSSWHKLENLGVFTDAASMIAHGEDSGAWPVSTEFRKLMSQLEDGSLIFSDYQKNLVGHYKAHPPRILGTVGGKFNPTTKEQRDSIIEAIVKAGGKPTGAFSLREGRTIIGTFEINGRGPNGISTQMLLADSTDGRIKLCLGFTSIRVVCANTLARAFMDNGNSFAKLGHNSTLEEKVKILIPALENAVELGHSVQETYSKALQIKLSNDDYNHALDIVAPIPEGEEVSQRAITRVENEREDLLKAMTLAVNRDGEDTLASLWNGLTFLVDRKFDKKGNVVARAHGDSSPLDSLLFGERGRQVDTIQKQVVMMVEMIDRYGKIVEMPIDEAVKSTSSGAQDLAALLERPARSN